MLEVAGKGGELSHCLTSVEGTIVKQPFSDKQTSQGVGDGAKIGYIMLRIGAIWGVLEGDRGLQEGELYHCIGDRHCRLLWPVSRPSHRRQSSGLHRLPAVSHQPSAFLRLLVVLASGRRVGLRLAKAD